jgi:heme/copper-type cytochrome/quinol oxidase subunit 3
MMWAFLGSDCMFFGSLIATYIVYRGRSESGPLPVDVFSIPITSISTFVLLMSSMSMVLAYAALSRGNMKMFRVWLASTAIMGMTFLAFQVFEFRTFALEGLTPRTNLFGTTFFTLTGFHGAHVTVGVIWLLSFLFYSIFKPGAITPQKEFELDLAALYWHFVDIVWIVIFTVVYLFGVFDFQQGII